MRVAVYRPDGSLRLTVHADDVTGRFAAPVRVEAGECVLLPFVLGSAGPFPARRIGLPFLVDSRRIVSPVPFIASSLITGGLL